MAAVAGLLLLAAGAGATTLVEISGDEQIRQSQTIFRGRVERIDAARDWSKPRGPIISTIQFTPVAVYKGAVAASVTLRFLGGRTADLELKVNGMPQFEVGKEYILFVSGESGRACPVVGWTGGSLGVSRKAGAEDSVPVTAPAADWLRHTSIARDRAVMPASLGLAKFEALLREHIAEVGARK